MKKVVILGSGPAGLMSVAAGLATPGLAGMDFHVLSVGGKSPLYGAQYLHEPIPDYTDENDYVRVRYQTWGSADDYKRKVYGQMWDGTVSPEDLDEEHSAWDIRETYDRLWDDFGQFVEPTRIDHAGLRILMDGRSKLGKVELVISSIPKAALCIQGHQFRSANIVAAGDAPDLGIKLPYRQAKDNSVICNGNREPSWYRLSNIFGHKTVEWPDGMTPSIPSAAVIKPLSNNCDCFPDVLHVGRYGKWEKGVLSHTAYGDVRDYLAART